MTALISSSSPVARKDHRCNYCGGVIPKGEKYNRDFLIYDYPYSWKNHFRCGMIASKLSMFDDCDEGVNIPSYNGEIFAEMEKFILDTFLKEYEELKLRVDELQNL